MFLYPDLRLHPLSVVTRTALSRLCRPSHRSARRLARYRSLGGASRGSWPPETARLRRGSDGNHGRGLVSTFGRGLVSGLAAVWLVFLVAVWIVTVVAVWMVFWSRFGQWSCRGLVSIPCRVLVSILGRGLAIGPVVTLIQHSSSQFG